MSKHTPGPWFSDSFGNIWRRNPTELYQNGGGVAGDKPIAIAYKGWHRENENGYPVEANAALIADAPALLKALAALLVLAEQMEVALDSHFDCRSIDEIEFDGGLPDEIIQARALISKHRGEL